MTKPVVVTDDTFEQTVLQSDVPVVVDFWAPWCGPCRTIAPALETLAGEYEGRLTIAKVNVDEQPQWSSMLGIQSIPTLIAFKSGQAIGRLVGAYPESAYREVFDQILSIEIEEEQPTMAQPIKVSDKDFEEKVLKSDIPVVVDFWAPWCAPCRVVAPILDRLAVEYEGRLTIAKVNTDEDQQHAVEYGIRGIPTLLIFKDGKEVDRLVGSLPEAEYKQKFDKVLA